MLTNLNHPSNHLKLQTYSSEGTSMWIDTSLHQPHLFFNHLKAIQNTVSGLKTEKKSVNLESTRFDRIRLANNIFWKPIQGFWKPIFWKPIWKPFLETNLETRIWKPANRSTG